jgi:hypothetical protein
MSDTSTRIEQRYTEMLMSKSPVERLKMTSRMFDSARKLVMAGILKERGHIETPRLRAQLFLRIYGHDFTAAEREEIIKKISNRQLRIDS